MGAVGHMNAFAWECQAGLPFIVGRVIPETEIDGLGYLFGVWDLP